METGSITMRGLHSVPRHCSYSPGFFTTTVLNVDRSYKDTLMNKDFLMAHTSIHKHTWLLIRVETH